MKKIGFVLLFIATCLILTSGCANEERRMKNIVFTATIEELQENSMVVSTTDNVGFDKATVSLSPGVEMPVDLLVGRVVKLTILPEIAESYPVQVKAVKIESLEFGAKKISQPVNYTVSFLDVGSYQTQGALYFADLAENASTLSLKDKRHIPAISIKDKEAMDKFLAEGKGYFQFGTRVGSERFDIAAQKYDTEFFDESQLLILYLQEGSGSIRHEIKDVSLSKGTLSVKVATIVPEGGTADMADWFIVLEIGKNQLRECTQIDAFYEEK